MIFIRIILSWFSLRGNSYGYSQNKIVHFLHSATDPYLNWFRRFKFLQFGFLDFSAIIAIVVLYFVMGVFSKIAQTGSITLIYIISLIIGSLWSMVSSILLIITIILVVRIVFIQLNKYSQIFYNLDGYIEPSVRKFSNLITKRFTSYKTNLIILTVALVIARFLGKFLISYLLYLLNSIG